MSKASRARNKNYKLILWEHKFVPFSTGLNSYPMYDAYTLEHTKEYIPYKNEKVIYPVILHDGYYINIGIYICINDSLITRSVVSISGYDDSCWSKDYNNWEDALRVYNSITCLSEYEIKELGFNY